MQLKTMRRIILIGAIGIIICFVIVSLFTGNQKDIGECTNYVCDVKNFQLATTIEISKEGDKFAKVKGDIFKFVTDPLTMYDMNDSKIAYAGDSYHLIAQDSHSIYVDDEVTIEMVGLVDLFGETYDIYNKEGEKIAKAKFNAVNTYGEIYDMDDNLIADYTSNIIFKDFDVRIVNSSILDERSVLMIFCSYYSDQAADNNSDD